MRRRRLGTALIVLSALFVPAAGAAQTVDLGKDMSLTFRGFISATAFAQDQDFTFGNGQNAEFPIPPESHLTSGPEHVPTTGQQLALSGLFTF